jgi:hypothetical protein
MNLKQMILLMLLTLAAIPAMAQGVEVDYNNPKKYIVGGVMSKETTISLLIR